MNKIDVNTVFSNTEIRMMNEYVESYAKESHSDAEDRVPFEQVLDKVWANAKYPLYKVFGEKLILTKPFEFKESTSKLSALIRQSEEFKALRDEIICVMPNFRSSTYYNEYNQESEILEWVYQVCLDDTWGLAENSLQYNESFTLTLPNGTTIKPKVGMKPLRILSKVADAYGLQTFENFRLAHSRILNAASLRGELCLSIHPLDYMTMSDNTNDWASCMSWRDRGCYRRGTVEMMNSPLVIVAYLKSEHTTMKLFPGEWNSKKWRQLFVVSEEAITSVKPYPYISNDASAAAAKWIAELLNQAGGNYDIDNMAIYYNDDDGFVEYDGQERVELWYETNTMYNDFESDCTHHIICSKDWSGKYRTINYSGQEQCVWCGEIDFSLPDYDFECVRPEFLICVKCGAPDSFCRECGTPAWKDELVWIDGEHICPGCVSCRTQVDTETGERHFYRNMRCYDIIGDDTFSSDLYYRGDYPRIWLCEESSLNQTLYPRRCRCSHGWCTYEYFRVSDLTDEEIARLHYTRDELITLVSKN